MLLMWFVLFVSQHISMSTNYMRDDDSHGFHCLHLILIINACFLQLFVSCFLSQQSQMQNLLSLMLDPSKWVPFSKQVEIIRFARTSHLQEFVSNERTLCRFVFAGGRGILDFYPSSRKLKSYPSMKIISFFFFFATKMHPTKKWNIRLYEKLE